MALWLLQTCEKRCQSEAFEDGPRGVALITGAPCPAGRRGAWEWSSESSEGWPSWTVGSNSDSEEQEMADLYRPSVLPQAGELEWPDESPASSPFRGAFTVVVPLESKDIFVSPRPGVLMPAQGGVPTGTEGFSWGQTRGDLLQVDIEGYGRPSQFCPTPSISA